ncbi:hypothetical protein RJF2_14295 [Klebsiella pneumoniae subsp. pneumoniae]|nr:hypothetical protein RJF2_14295 [Klebsiella pneumoniae subsp. pneumoniae]
MVVKADQKITIRLMMSVHWGGCAINYGHKKVLMPVIQRILAIMCMLIEWEMVTKLVVMATNIEGGG